MTLSREAQGTLAEAGEFFRGRNVLWAAGLPARAVVLALLYVYRRLFSPILGVRCRFHPSCSAYAEEAVRVHGAAKGLILSVWRVLRCSPLSAGGLDAVPLRGAWRGPRGGRLYDGAIQPEAPES